MQRCCRGSVADMLHKKEFVQSNVTLVHIDSDKGNTLCLTGVSQADQSNSRYLNSGTSLTLISAVAPSLLEPPQMESRSRAAPNTSTLVCSLTLLSATPFCIAGTLLMKSWSKAILDTSTLVCPASARVRLPTDTPSSPSQTPLAPYMTPVKA